MSWETTNPSDSQRDTNLPSDDEEAEIAEALRRSAEMDANPELGMSLEQFDEYIRSRWGTGDYRNDSR
jgi:hypothetical protein